MEIPNFNPTIPTAGRSRKQWVAILAISLILGVIFYYFRQPILDFAQNAWTWLSTTFSGLSSNPFFGNLFTWMSNNPIPTLTAGFSLVASGLTLAKYYSEAKAKTAALTAQMQSQTALQNYQGQFQDYMTQKETQIQQLQAQVNTKGYDSLQSALTESQGLVTSQAQQIRSLQDQISALNNIIMLKDTQVIEKIVVK